MFSIQLDSAVQTTGAKSVKVRRTIVVLSASPGGCLVLAGLTILLGVAFVAGWVPSSDVPRY